MTRCPLAFLVVLSLAIPAGSIQGSMPASMPALPPADLSYIPAAYRHDIALAASVCGVPVRILAGVAFAESSFRPDPAHADPLDRGMFGLHESTDIRAERVAKYGEYDPLDPGTAAIVAARILAEHRVNFGDWSRAIAAYRQGASGVRRDGIGWWYVERVRNGI